MISQVIGGTGTLVSALGSEKTKLFLNSEGQVWGLGKENMLGIGSTSDNLLHELTNTGISDVVAITAGNGFYIATKSDGTVWGTGTNENGIMGRWIGVGRGTSNSRYKTAFNWVECTELEL